MKQLRYFIRRVSSLMRRPILRRMELSAILAAANPKGTLSDKVRWCETLLVWIRSGSSFSHEFDQSTGQLHAVRIKFLLSLLERNSSWKRHVAETLRSVLEQTSGVELFSRTGLLQEGGLIAELADRSLRKILPAPPRDRDLDDVFPRLFNSMNDAIWIEHLPEEIIEKVWSVIRFQDADFNCESLRRSLAEAMIVLAEQIAFRGLSSEIRNRLFFPSVTHSPFLAFRRVVEESAAAAFGNQRLPLKSLDDGLRQCHQAIDSIYAHLDTQGVSVRLVYALECQRSALHRIELMAQVLRIGDGSGAPRAKLTAITYFLGSLIRESLASRKIRPLLQNNLRLLSQKIVERSAESGEHYILQTKAQYRKMLKSGLGGGAVTVFTVMIKFMASFAGLPLFFEGWFVGLNYSLSFISMQLLGFSLATKQPAMTGPALAEKMRHLKSPRDRRGFVEEVARISRTQFAAAVGNVVAVMALALLFDFCFRQVTGHSVLSIERAHYVVHSTHPFRTLTILYAAWTGAVLWLGGIAAGWTENWVVYRKLPEAIALNRSLVFILGAGRAKKLSQFFSENIGGIVGSSVLGFTLGFTPVFGKFFGFPFEVRHVTLAAGSLAFALGPIFRDPAAFPYWDVALAMLGVGITFAINLATSFSLAFLVAARAREVPRRSIMLLLRRTGIQFMHKPIAFFYLR